jgi:hypothetical protein
MEEGHEHGRQNSLEMIAGQAALHPPLEGYGIHTSLDPFSLTADIEEKHESFQSSYNACSTCISDTGGQLNACF